MTSNGRQWTESDKTPRGNVRSRGTDADSRIVSSARELSGCLHPLSGGEVLYRRTVFRGERCGCGGRVKIIPAIEEPMVIPRIGMRLDLPAPRFAARSARGFSSTTQPGPKKRRRFFGSADGLARLAFAYWRQGAAGELIRADVRIEYSWRGDVFARQGGRSKDGRYRAKSRRRALKSSSASLTRTGAAPRSTSGYSGMSRRVGGDGAACVAELH